MLLIFFSIFFTFSFTQPIQCNGNPSNTIPISGSFGCSPLNTWAAVTSVFKGPPGYVCSFKPVYFSIGASSSRASVEVKNKNKTVTIFNNQYLNGNFLGSLFNLQDAEIIFQVINGNGAYFTFFSSCVIPSSFIIVPSGQDVSISNRSMKNSVLSFGLNTYIHTYGESYIVHVQARSNAMKAPSFFIGEGFVPTIERYSYTNATVSTGGQAEFYYTLKSPKGVPFYVTMFTFGNAWSINVNLKWKYSIPVIESGKTYQNLTRKGNSFAMETAFCRQAIVPTNRSKVYSVNFEMSRDAPGGIVDFYLSPGFIPDYTTPRDLSFHLTVAESFKQFKFPINAADQKENPGVIILCALTPDPEAAIVYRVTWN